MRKSTIVISFVVALFVGSTTALKALSQTDANNLAEKKGAENRLRNRNRNSNDNDIDIVVNGGSSGAVGGGWGGSGSSSCGLGDGHGYCPDALGEIRLSKLWTSSCDASNDWSLNAAFDGVSIGSGTYDISIPEITNNLLRGIFWQEGQTALN